MIVAIRTPYVSMMPLHTDTVTFNGSGAVEMWVST